MKREDIIEQSRKILNKRILNEKFKKMKKILEDEEKEEINSKQVRIF